VFLTGGVFAGHTYIYGLLLLAQMGMIYSAVAVVLKNQKGEVCKGVHLPLFPSMAYHVINV